MLCLECRIDRRRRLSTVYYLKVFKPGYNRPLICDLSRNRLGRGCYAVVEREEKLRLVFQCSLDSFVYIAPRLQKDTYILLEQPRAPSVIDVGQVQAGDSSEINLISVVWLAS